MCGIFGYVGKKQAKDIIIAGLKRLEYRGYDSWGIGTLNTDGFEVIKQVGAVGEVGNTEVGIGATMGIGHTRWATHGGVTSNNAHPHYSSDKSFILAQNGIVENYQELKKELIDKNYKFTTQTDTEVIVRLIEEKLTTISDFQEAVRQAFLDLKGRNTIIVLSKVNGSIIAIRNGSPLVVGVGENEYYFASDTLSFLDQTNKAILINNLEMVVYKENNLKLFNVQDGVKIKYSVKELTDENIEISKEGYDYYMLKEIVEQKHTIREASSYTEEELSPLVDTIKNSRNVYTIGAGTAYYASAQCAYFLRTIANINAIELKSYEIDSYKDIFSPDDIVIVFSQSGETADTIEALEIAKENQVKIASLVNMVGSTITRLSDYPYYSRSGPEICVASTKAFTAQQAWGIMLSAAIRGEYKKYKDLINTVSSNLEKYFSDELFTQIRELVNVIKNKEHFFVLGRGQNYYLALEAALKVKEITYKHFEGFASGELKHGVIALIEKGTPVFIIIPDDSNYNNMLSSAAEVKARGAYVIGVGSKDNELFDNFIKTINVEEIDPLVNVIPFQLLSYFMALGLGNNPDRPRNLAKSVTVK